MPTLSQTQRGLRRHPYKTVLFDLDNTLGDRPAAVRRWAEKLYFSQPGLMAKVERADAVSSIVQWDAGGHVFAKPLFEKLVTEWPFVRDGVEELVEWHRREYPAAFRPNPQVSRLITRIMRVGIRWGVVTNGPPFQRDKLVALGLDRIAGCVVISGEFSAAKPAPAIFQEALRLLDEDDPGASIFVGDSPAADIEGARSASMDTAWLSHGRKWPAELREPTHTLAKFSDLAAVLGF
jgi:putative hydrolase of the HAD superfamily